MADDRLVYVVDDDRAVRESAALLLEGAGYTPETYPLGSAFLEAIDRRRPGCILLDIHMPDIDGLEVQKALKDRQIAFPVIVLTGQGDIGIAVRAMKGGAFEFLEKPYQNSALLDAIAEAFVHLQTTSVESARRDNARTLIDSLSKREFEVMRGLLAGLPNKIIAFELGISIRTVEIYRANVMDKLRARSLSSAVRIALAAGMLPLIEREDE